MVIDVRGIALQDGPKIRRRPGERERGVGGAEGQSEGVKRARFGEAELGGKIEMSNLANGGCRLGHLGGNAGKNSRASRLADGAQLFRVLCECVRAR